MAYTIIVHVSVLDPVGGTRHEHQVPIAINVPVERVAVEDMTVEELIAEVRRRIEAGERYDQRGELQDRPDGE